jgi:biopolymer transport protein ExbB/TolQ
MTVAEAAILTVVPSLSRRIAWLPMLANIATLLGILGAIANLHNAFADSVNVIAPTRALLEGVAYALRPLGVGVLTAIPLVAGHALLVHDAERLTDELEEFSTRLVNALIQRPDVRLGHRD